MQMKQGSHQRSVALRENLSRRMLLENFHQAIWENFSSTYPLAGFGFSAEESLFECGGIQCLAALFRTGPQKNLTHSGKRPCGAL